MNLSVALLHGLIWSIMWAIMVNACEIFWPQLFLHDYPKELQEVIKLPPLKNKVLAYGAEILMMTAIVAFILWSGIYTYRQDSVGYATIYLHIWVICMFWNTFDLLVMDWGIFCTWKPKYIVLPGSEGHPAYKNYKFHFIGFLKGIVIESVAAIVIAGICYGVLKFFVW